MRYKNRQGEVIEQENLGDKIGSFFYGNAVGRLLLKPFTKPMFSRFVGAVLDSKLSVVLALPYRFLFDVDMDQCKPKFYSSYNEYFTRELKEELRPVCAEIGCLIAPADGKLSVYSIDQDSKFEIKNVNYSLAELLHSKELANQYQGGYAAILRLTGEDNHHYCYVASGTKGKNHFIPGNFHALHPMARELRPVYQENSREFCRIRTEYFGELVQMEVGAIAVGRICNKETGTCQVEKGVEKGYFAYGGSTIVILTKKGMVDYDIDLLENTEKEIETIVQRGERIGYRQVMEDALKFFKC